jgi:hypothetical protein
VHKGGKAESDAGYMAEGGALLSLGLWRTLYYKHTSPIPYLLRFSTKNCVTLLKI